MIILTMQQKKKKEECMEASFSSEIFKLLELFIMRVIQI